MQSDVTSALGLARSVVTRSIRMAVGWGIVALTLSLSLDSRPCAAQQPPVAPANPFLTAETEDAGWPFVRGPSYDGHSPETEIADAWPDTGPPVLWTRELGQGYSAFVARDRRVFTQAQSLGGQFVYCLDGDSGETIWRYRYGWPYEAIGVYPGPRATPTLSGRYVYFAAPNGLIGCLTVDSGRLVWSVNVLERYTGRGIGFGYACSPTVIDGMVLLPVGGEQASMVALDAETGSEIWVSGSDPASYSPAYPIEHDGRKLVVGYLQNALVVCDRRSGETLVRIPLSHGYDEHSAWPIHADGYLWFSGPFRSGSQLIQLTSVKTPASSADDRAAGEFEKIWKSGILSNDVSSSVLVDGNLYGFDIFDAQSKTQRASRGKFRCIDFLTGLDKWSIGTGRPRRKNSARTSDEPEIGQAGIIVADGKLIVLNELGELILLRATPERYEELARTSVLGGELTWTPPALHRGRVYLRNHTRAVCVFVGNPERLQATRPLLSVTDVPQSQYRDLAAMILAIEPEYAFDVPSSAWLRNWYWTSLGILGAAAVLGFAISRVVPGPHRQSIGFGVYAVTAFLAGAAGTTVLSQRMNDFVFTWPVCLFVALQPVVQLVRKRSDLSGSRTRRWMERLSLLFFLAVALAYFAICRRLSLIFEWTFLVGFLAAAPVLRLSSLCSGEGLRSQLLRAFLAGVAFTAFYGASVALLFARY